MNSPAASITPSLSIVVVCWNNLEEVKRTINSIRSQTFNDIELLVVDGGSDKELVTYISESSDKHISEPDKGVYDAMNKGIQLASGGLLLFLNSGDSFYNEDSVKNLMQGRADPAFKHNESTITGSTLYTHTKSDFKWIVRASPGSTPSHMSTAVPTSILKESMFDIRFRILGDIDLWSRLRQRQKLQIVTVPEIISVFEYGDGLSSMPTNNALKAFERMMIHHRDNKITAAFYLSNFLLYLRTELFSRIPLPVQFWVWRKRHNWEKYQ